MKNNLTLSTALVVGAYLPAGGRAEPRHLTVVSWGGTCQDAQREIYFKPCAAKTGKPVLDEARDGGIGAVQAKVKAGIPGWGVIALRPPIWRSDAPTALPKSGTGTSSAARTSRHRPRAYGGGKHLHSHPDN